MITEISVSNFKSWKQIPPMRLAPITGLFGTNSSGKTSILQLLMMLKQTVESSDRTQVLNFGEEKDPVNLGSFKEAIHKHDTSEKLIWSVRWKRDEELKVFSPENRTTPILSGAELGFDSAVGQLPSGKLAVSHLSYKFAGNKFTLRRKAEGESKYDLKTEEGTFEFIRQRGRVWDLPAPVKCYGFPDRVKAFFQNAGFLSDLELAFEELFSRQLFYLGPLREHPQREYKWAGSEPSDMGRRGEKVVDALLSARNKGDYISRGQGVKRIGLEQYVAHWLKELGLIHSFRVEDIAPDSKLYKVSIKKTPNATDVLITDVGFGVSQVLPVLVLCFYVPEGSTIILEQPEIHLHPSVQSGLADVFIDAMKKRSIQVIFESHSEHLLRRMQRRIAEKVISPEQAALYFCEMESGSSKLTPLAVDLFGEISNWPKDFFGDEFGEMAAISKAAIAQKINSK